MFCPDHQVNSKIFKESERGGKKGKNEHVGNTTFGETVNMLELLFQPEFSEVT